MPLILTAALCTWVAILALVWLASRLTAREEQPRLAYVRVTPPHARRR
jgi:hypothetical protein